jgi:hypothetical protein
VCSEQDQTGRTTRISRWTHLHFQQARELDLSVISVEREAATDTKRDPRVSWFVMRDAVIPLPQIAKQYRRRFSHEHCYRFRHRKRCSGLVCMCARLHNLSAGVGWWPWCLTSCIWRASLGKRCIGHGSAKIVPSRHNRCGGSCLRFCCRLAHRHVGANHAENRPDGPRAFTPSPLRASRSCANRSNNLSRPVGEHDSGFSFIVFSLADGVAVPSGCSL